ncbi:MAG: rRNA maturation RNase YbeY [bacterium]
MPLILELQNESTASDVPEQAQLEEWLRLAFPDVPDMTLVVRVVDEDEGQTLNEQFRGKPAPTNVLSFPYEAPPGMPDELGSGEGFELPVQHLGDLVICAPVVAQEALEQGKRSRDHWAHMLIHGVLHLFGYDHISDADAREMESLEVLKLFQIGVPDPYVA